MNKKRLGSVGAILAGLVAILVLSNRTDAVLEATGVFPSVAVQRERGLDTTCMVALALVYRGVYAAADGYVTAALAPEHPPLQGNIANRARNSATPGYSRAWQKRRSSQPRTYPPKMPAAERSAMTITRSSLSLRSQT
jgi:hypothetical protein